MVKRVTRVGNLEVGIRYSVGGGGFSEVKISLEASCVLHIVEVTSRPCLTIEAVLEDLEAGFIITRTNVPLKGNHEVGELSDAVGAPELTEAYLRTVLMTLVALVAA